MNIMKLTPCKLRAAARTAAELHQTRAEANHYEPGSELWHIFNEAMREAEAEIHGLRRLFQEGACTC